MGRVARYKKVKACDPYSSKNRGRLPDADTVGVWGLGDSGRKAKKRSLTSQKLRSMRKKSGAMMTAKTEFDVAPESDDFDLADLVGSLKREKCSFEEEQLLQQRTPVTAPTVARNEDDTAAAAAAALSNSKAKPQITSLEEKEEQKLMNKVKQQVEPKPASLMAAEGRLPGESKRAYNKRVKLETRQIIQRSSRLEHNPEKRQKKKDFLNNKKKNKRKRAAWDDDEDDDVPEQNGDDRRFESEGTSTGTTTTGRLLTGEQAVAARARATQVRFGEQAERPPVFAQLPRGASKKQPPPPASSSNKKKEEQIEAERQAMDRMRRKVQAQYAAIKAKRKQNGDFHL